MEDKSEQIYRNLVEKKIQESNKVSPSFIGRFLRECENMYDKKNGSKFGILAAVRLLALQIASETAIENIKQQLDSIEAEGFEGPAVLEELERRIDN